MPPAYPSMERLTKGARATLRHAYIAAWDLRAPGTGPEHLLLGLLAVPEGIAATVLHKRGLTFVAVRDAVARQRRQVASRGSALVPTPAAYQVVVDAVLVADRLQHHYVGTEHLLLGLLQTHDQAVQAMLTQVGFLPDRVAPQVFAEMGVSHGGDATIQSEGWMPSDG